MTDRRIKLNAVQCLECNRYLESKHRHDFRKCNCLNQTFVDGGLDYLRRGGIDLHKIKELSEYEDGGQDNN